MIIILKDERKSDKTVNFKNKKTSSNQTLH